MRTIVESGSKESKYVVADDATVEIRGDCIVLPHCTVCDLNSSNATLYENVTPPADWFGCKYLFDGQTWTPNPNWQEPTPPQAPAP